MTRTAKLTLLATTIVLANTLHAQVPVPAHVDDLELSLRSFPNKILFGDPLYIVVNVANRGTHSVRFQALDKYNVHFRATDNTIHIDYRLTDGGGALISRPPPLEYSPDQERNFYFQVFLPTIEEFSHPFWIGVEHLGVVRISCQIPIGRLALLSDQTSAVITPRDNQELESLRRWSRLTPNRSENDTQFLPGCVGDASLYDVLTRQDTKEIASVVQSGGLADLLQFTLKLQELETATTNRQALSQALVDWVKSQPNIKRQWLANRLKSFDYLLSRPAFESLKQLVE